MFSAVKIGSRFHYVCAEEGERQGRHYSEEFKIWYDLYACKKHGFHVDADWDKEW